MKSLSSNLLASAACAWIWLVAGCAAEPVEGVLDDGYGSSGAEAALGSAALPAGLVCGMIHSAYGRDGGCRGYATIDSLASGYQKIELGDYGLPASRGIVAQVRSTSSGDVSETTNLRLPRGTVCGAWHLNGNADFATGAPCLGTFSHPIPGLDPRRYVSSCPRGFELRGARDAKAPARAYYMWCEYTDPNNHCEAGACDDLVPSGTVCGLRDSDAPPTSERYCQGYGGRTCPSGWTFRGFYDDGRSSGHGLGWCTKD